MPLVTGSLGEWARAAAGKWSEDGDSTRRTPRTLAVHLYAEIGDVLRASLQIAAIHGEIMPPAHVADGVTLESRNRLPLRISAQHLVRVPLMRLSAIGSVRPYPVWLS